MRSYFIGKEKHMILKFEDGISIENADISIDGHVCTVKTKLVPNTKGFKVFGDYDVVLVDGTKFVTLYRELEDGFQLSDDGSVYVPPKPVPPTPPKPSRLDILEQRVNDLTPVVLSKKAYIGDTEVIFDYVPDGNISIFITTESGVSINNTTEKTDNSLKVIFEELTETAEVIVSIN